MYINNGISISFKKITFFLLASGLILFLGGILKNAIAIIPICAFLVYIASKNSSNYVLFLILWLYISNFFSGQGWINNSLATMLINAYYYIFVLFFLNYSSIHMGDQFDKSLLIWTVCYLFLIFSRNISLNIRSGLGLIIAPYYVYLYYIIRLPRKYGFSNNLFNLLLAIGILQVILSVMQVTGTIPPPITYSTLIRSQSRIDAAQIESGLDDAAVGTMGRTASNKTSWICTTLFLFLFNIGVFTKKNWISVLSLVFLLQYATIDSKTLFITTIIAIIMNIFLLNIFKFIFSKHLVILVAVLIFSMLLRTFIVQYYSTVTPKGVEWAVEEVNSSAYDVVNNISEWGKIRGFDVIYNHLLSNSLFTLFLGDNSSIFDMNSPLRKTENIFMARNNFTNSYSAFISTFARGGLLELLMVAWFYYLLFHVLKKRKFHTSIGLSFAKTGPVILTSTLIIMFIYTGLNFADLPFTLLIVLTGFVFRIEREFLEPVDICLNHSCAINGKPSPNFSPESILR